MAKPRPWTPKRIRAALLDRDLTLTKLAKREGLWDSACREAVSTSGNTRGQQAISRALGVPLWELFPHKFRKPTDEADHSRNGCGGERQKRGVTSSSERASA
ncbi:helix-turn-helix domain-containing protein [Jiella pacifica]|uniref:Ner winged helix-turn-helix DNA-binding domain-containing protein n=1 Tax=Jiella pacifica TaxID=2696469 RepID=A0A6N9SY75_9HYPH|nr:helix-turn-helix domain-containing protein [Jiella pacifica]NDW04034.1 hypothetical protein [Jiella pacifica]